MLTSKVPEPIDSVKRSDRAAYALQGEKVLHSDKETVENWEKNKAINLFISRSSRPDSVAEKSEREEKEVRRIRYVSREKQNERENVT